MDLFFVDVDVSSIAAAQFWQTEKIYNMLQVFCYLYYDGLGLRI
jgi:hypothetical protein